jgi:hypothetical protein
MPTVTTLCKVMSTKYALVRSEISRLLFQNEIIPLTIVLWLCWSYGRCTLSTVRRCYSVEIVLSTKVLELVFCMLEMLEGVRRRLEVVKNCTISAVGTAGDAICVEVVEVALRW